MSSEPVTGLVLSGGGARAAYQVGVLRALMALRSEVLCPAAAAAPSLATMSEGAT